MLRVALVEMPFGPVAWPSIGASLLKAELVRAGHPCRVVYLNHLFLRRSRLLDERAVGIYTSISDAFGVHLGEWIFARAAFPDTDLSRLDEEYLERLGQEPVGRDIVHAARRFRDDVEAFLRDCITSIDWAPVDVVGFSNSYSQLNASIALARILKSHKPDLPILVGGCGCAETMGVGVLRASSEFDAAALGEADEIIVDLVEAVHSRSSEALRAVPGIAWRDEQGSILVNEAAPRVTRLDDLPHPDYRDYYDYRPPQLAHLLPFYIPVEASRGCWWGAKHHCTFCGLNPNRMAYQRKSAGRFLAEVGALRRLYAPPRFMAVDNILPREYYDTVLPGLADASGGAEFFFEVKANFKSEQLRRFRDANAIQIQPGIESLRSRVLRHMQKGVTATANIFTLRLCQELGLRAHWSILFGFDGETEGDYSVIRELVRRMLHLPPPLGLFEVEVERFAPIYRLPAENGRTNLRPDPWYRYCYPVDDAVIQDLAYRFEADYIARPVDLSDRIRRLLGPLVETWRGSRERAEHQLVYEPGPDRSLLWRRVGRRAMTYALDGPAREVHDEFERPRRVLAVVPGLDRPDGYEPYLDERFLARAAAAQARPDPWILLRGSTRSEAYEQLLEHGLIVEEEGSALAVACRPHPARPPEHVLDNARQLGMAGV